MIRSKIFKPERSANAIEREITKLDRIRLFGSIRADAFYRILGVVETASSSGGIKTKAKQREDISLWLSEVLHIYRGTMASSASSNTFIFIPRVLGRNYPTCHGGLNFLPFPI
ncbi:hypothetical protein ACFXTN_013605 [Malus domestica]